MFCSIFAASPPLTIIPLFAGNPIKTFAPLTFVEMFGETNI
jgi:hypothetical protein